MGVSDDGVTAKPVGTQLSDRWQQAMLDEMSQLLALFVKREGGRVKFTEAEIANVTDVDVWIERQDHDNSIVLGTK